MEFLNSYYFYWVQSGLFFFSNAEFPTLLSDLQRTATTELFKDSGFPLANVGHVSQVAFVKGAENNYDIDIFPYFTDEEIEGHSINWWFKKSNPNSIWLQLMILIIKPLARQSISVLQLYLLRI